MTDFRPIKPNVDVNADSPQTENIPRTSGEGQTAPDTIPTVDTYIGQTRRHIEHVQPSFVKDLRFLRDLGVQLTPSPAIPIISADNINWACGKQKKGDNGPDPCLEHLDMNSALRAVREEGCFELVDNGSARIFAGDLSPEKFIHNQAVPFLESGRAFIDPKSNIKFPFITVNVDMKDGYYWVSAWDWMTGTSFFVQSYPTGEMKVEMHDQITAGLKRAIACHLRSSGPATALKNFVPLNPTERAESEALEVYRINHPAGWSDADIETAGDAWKKFSKTFKVTLEGRAFQSEIDRGDRHPDSATPLHLKLTDKVAGKLDDQALEIDGFIEKISFEITDDEKGLRLGRDSRLRWDYKQIYREKYGNHIEPLYGFHFATGKPYFMGFSIYPAYPLSANPSKSPVQTLGIDLSRFGFGDHPKLLTVKSLAPASAPSATNPYFLYSTLPDAEKPKADGVYEKTAILASRTEEMFGFRPGERVKNIFLVPSGSWNATVRFANPSTFFIWDEIFGDVRAGRADFVVPHEVFHNFDAQFGFSFEEKFTNLFTALTEAVDTEFFDSINERKFFSAEKGGYSGKHAVEFFASLTNSITAPQWEEKIIAMTPRIRGIYYHALQGLKGALISKRPAMASAPIFKLLEERIRALESKSGAGGKSPAYPPFDKLVRKSAAKLLEENDVRVITAKDFAKEVLREREPVAVAFYTEGNEHDIKFIRKVRSKFGGRFRLVAMSMEEGVLLISPFFNGSMGTQSLFVFARGKLAASVKGMDCQSDDEVIEKMIPWLDYLKPSHIPIIGTLIDLIRWR